MRNTRPSLKRAKAAHRLYHLSRLVHQARIRGYHYMDAEGVTGIYRRKQGGPLGVVGWVCEDLGKPKINALITSKARNDVPGPGFFYAPEWFREPVTNAEYPAYVERVLEEQDYPVLPMSVFVAADEAQQRHVGEHARSESGEIEG
jgi:hypothetical protein